MHFDAFKHYREEERYEVNLAAGRLNSLLASQAFLFTGWAIIHGPTGREAPKLVLISLPIIALVICLCAFLAICAAVVMIHRLQLHGARLISEDRNLADPPELINYHIDRKPNDGFHFWGVDAFSLVVPIAFLLLWLIILGYSITLERPNLALQRTPAAAKVSPASSALRVAWSADLGSLTAMDLTFTQANLIASLRTAADRGRTRRVVYCTEYLGYLPFGLYHWIEVNGQAIEASSLPSEFTRGDLDVLESVGLLSTVGHSMDAEDESESRTTYELRTA